MIPSSVTLVDVGPRDGLQNEAQTVATAHKVELVQRLQAAGLREIEVTSFVSPKWVPQMSDNAAVMAALQHHPDVRYAVLTPNMKGFEAALPSRPDEVVVFGSASEAFSQRNINCSVAESIERFRPVVAAAHANGIKVRAAISCALGCPYQGEVSADEVERVVRLMKDIGVDHCGVADTIGTGTPRRVQAAIERALRHYPLHEVSGHFHDTYGQALANVYACLELGLHRFDASVAGLGGCPYAKGATGNVATEDIVFMLDGLGIATGIDIAALVDAGAFISGVLGRPPVSRAGKALLARRGISSRTTPPSA
jgi:hydroxymethylglutaryl-CoA lyase